jgi:hypothetical protein
MKRPTFRTLSILIFLAILISACKLPASEGTPSGPNVGITATTQPAPLVPTNTKPGYPPPLVVTALPTASPTSMPPTATFTPSPSATTAPTSTSSISSTCTDLAKFVDDVTIPDDTEILPGQEFIKIWRLQNVGTCTWNNQYSLIFANGVQMNGSSPLPLATSVPPNGTLDVSVTLQAPGTTGTYRGEWKLKNSSGVIFGLGKNATESFYLQIKVVEGVSELNLGPATWTDNLDSAYYWYLLDTANTKFTQSDGKLVMKSITPGGGEEWGLSNQPSLDDYYLQATFITGDSCSGLDRYGLLARAPEANKGYVYEFSCDGHYRLYTWDGQHYNALQEWRTSESILSGAKQTNIMGIYMKGNDIRLYVNGHKIAEFTDDTYGHGQFGLVIGSTNTPNFTVSVDQVAYWDLNP